MSTIAIEDLERLSLVSRLGRPVKAGDSTLRFRAILEGIAGEQFLVDPFSAYAETVTVASYENRDANLTGGVLYTHNVNAPVIRKKFAEFLATNLESVSLAANAIAAATAVTLTNVLNGMGNATHWIVIDPYTVECEVRRAGTVSGNIVTFTTPLAYTHSENDPVLLVDKPALNVKWFGAKGDGVSDDTVPLQRAWDQLPTGTQSYGALNLGATDQYLITDQLNWRDKSFITVYGNGARIITKAGVSYANKCLVNFGGSAYCQVSQLYIQSNNYSVAPAAGLVLGRTSGGFHGGFFHGSHISVTGYFSCAAYYNVGSECSTFISSVFENYLGDGAFIGNDDTQSLLGVSAGQLTGWYYGCIFHGFAAGHHCVKLRGYVADHAFIGCYGVPGLGGHVFHCEAGAGAIKYISNITIDNFRHEYASGDNSDTRFIYNDADEVLGGLSIRGVTWSNTGIAGDDPDYIYEFHGSVNDLWLFMRPNTFNKKALLINSDCVLTNAKVWGDKGTGGVNQVTVEAGATINRSNFYWPNGIYPYDATPAGMNLVQHVPGFVGNSDNAVIFAEGDTTPTVGGGLHFQTGNTNPTTITDFDDGFDGQEIFVIFLDNQTTLNFANFTAGSNLSGNDGANYTTHLYDVLKAVKHGGYWYCEIIQSKF
jgi:hypothetical protein